MASTCLSLSDNVSQTLEQYVRHSLYQRLALSYLIHPKTLAGYRQDKLNFG